MIKNFSDLSANERTYLSWIRTSIAMMAFGFIIEKFELFLNVISSEVHFKANLKSSGVIEAVGLAMMFVSVLMMIAATARYMAQHKKIQSEKMEDASTRGVGFMIALFLIVISLFLVIYIWARLLY
ncbi:MAG: hypothetical protein COY58_07280 [Gammaproteobacteria bacterium CG_4_10_14_0_8_um_filter_38_16]|nr:MAG: hypothetical protein COY58_07280 [Gammaproteobacteria bacterium CG_4_10_14_0_8_um_filter_38_16]PJA02968.1 MAG: hypothetical protein COX72_07505 [Gammaproteobacteria bacterium CG_4_10_14_0_2_um_filter_38_22]PJB09434.1 MAG: hypothetical protein CO120_09960 [Gammaproteobacteria bacterium CG_4_9_14_3_um_filter_38_9]